MPVLKNPRHELFAQELAKGRSQAEAYAAAGYKPDDSHAARLAGNGRVAERVQEIVGAAAERAGITVQGILEELARIGFSNMLDFCRVEGVDLVHDFSKLSRDQAAAIHELVVETRTDYTAGEDAEREAVPIRKVRFKLADKRAALVELGKHLGMFKERAAVHPIKIMITPADAEL